MVQAAWRLLCVSRDSCAHLDCALEIFAEAGEYFIGFFLFWMQVISLIDIQPLMRESGCPELRSCPAKHLGNKEMARRIER